jgi:hypothetical protein
MAADFDGNGQVSLVDAIGVLKHIVGLPAPTPRWRFVSDTDLSVLEHPILEPGVLETSAVLASSAGGAWKLGLVGILTGDVDGDVASAPNATALEPDYLVRLATEHHLPLSMFGIYPS